MRTLELKVVIEWDPDDTAFAEASDHYDTFPSSIEIYGDFTVEEVASGRLARRWRAWRLDLAHRDVKPIR